MDPDCGKEHTPVESVLYAEINAFAIVIVLALGIRLHMLDRTTAHDWLRYTMVAESLFFFADLCCVLIDGNPDIPVAWNYAVNILYFSMTVICPCCWIRYVMIELERRPKRCWSICLMIPAGFIVLLSAITPVAQWLFGVSDANLYFRGTFYPLQPLVSLGYFLGAAGIAVSCMNRKKNFAVRKRAGSILFFSVVPIFAALLDIIIVDVPFICPITTIALVVYFITLQGQYISKDALTGLDNRYELSFYLESLRNQPITVILADVDRFKKINDTFGHLEGDRVLKRFANVLRNVGEANDYRTFRYGGDEFLVLIESENMQDAENAIQEIERELEKDNKGHSVRVSGSFGSAIGAAGMTEDQIKSLIEAADQNMYQHKNYTENSSKAAR